MFNFQTGDGPLLGVPVHVRAPNASAHGPRLKRGRRNVAGSAGGADPIAGHDARGLRDAHQAAGPEQQCAAHQAQQATARHITDRDHQVLGTQILRKAEKLDRK